MTVRQVFTAIMVSHPTDLVAEAEKGGRVRRLLALGEIDAVRAGYKQYVVRRQWILGKEPKKARVGEPADLVSQHRLNRL